MIDFFTALYCEGPTDEKFLLPLLERLLNEMVFNRQGEPVNIAPVVPINKAILSADTGAERLLEAARFYPNHRILFVHLDADAQSVKEARKARFEPGLLKINALPKTENLCRHLIPIIPERMIEAWMLADWQSVLAELDSAMPEAALRKALEDRGCKLPEKPHQTASDRDPKHTLEQIVKIAGRKSHTLGDLYEPVAERIDLKTLRKLKAFQQFESELIAKLAELRIIGI